MHILLTRPLEDCSEMILKFQSLGHQVSHLPLIRIEKINYGEINFSEYSGIIFTSANAVKFLKIEKLDKKIKCFCVGSVTEKKARSIGFQNTISAVIVFWKPMLLAFFSVTLPTQKHLIFLSSFSIFKNLTAFALVKIIPLYSEKLISL